MGDELGDGMYRMGTAAIDGGQRLLVEATGEGGFDGAIEDLPWASTQTGRIQPRAAVWFNEPQSDLRGTNCAQAASIVVAQRGGQAQTGTLMTP